MHIIAALWLLLAILVPMRVVAQGNASLPITIILPPSSNGGTGTVTSLANPSIFGVTCSVANATTVPAITCAAGAITVTSIDGLTITTTTGTLTIPNGITLNAGPGGTLGALAFVTPGANVATALGLSLNGSGAVAGTTSPNFVTPLLGAATATSINGLTLSSSTGTFTLTNAKTFAVQNTLTFTGTDSSSVAFGAGGTVLYGNQTITLSGDCTGSGATSITITCTKINGDANIAFLDVAQSFTKPQRTNTISPTISTATFTPVFSTSQNYRIALSSACPCTLANPAAIVAGQSGMFEYVQDGTGSRTIGTYGSEYMTAGGTSSNTLSTAAGAVDYQPYYVDSTASFIVLGGIIKGATH